MQSKFFRFIKQIPPILSIGLCFALLTSAGVFIYAKKYPVKTSADSENNQPTSTDNNPNLVADEEASKALAKDPPKHGKSSLSSKTVSTSAGRATIVSEGSISDQDISTLQRYAGSGPVSNIYYSDTTGNYPGLGDTVKDYLKSKLLWSNSDISYMYEIRVVDCPGCSYGGLYTGSYIYGSGDDITRAFGWITLNVAPYKNSAYFTDYMKLILSHEYGHHYTLYHRFVDYDIPVGERFPATYYSVRPLSTASTRVDYSAGWGNCDVEIIAEDYSYFFSGYGYHAMSGTYGYPSNPGTKNFLYSLASATPPSDTTPPAVSISSPVSGATVSGITNIVASASDNVGVTRVEIYVDDAKVSTLSNSPYSYAWETRSYANGSHTVKAKAFDANQSTETSISVSVDNTSTDSEDPVVTVSAPPSTPYEWTTGNLQISATANDNVAVTKIEIYIGGTLVAAENSGSIERYWVVDGVPAGTYHLLFKAYDSAGNIGEKEIVVNKT